MRIDYLIVSPNNNTTDSVEYEISNIFQQLDKELKRNSILKNRVFRTTVFYNPSKLSGKLGEIKQSLNDYFSPNLPTISYLAQPPVDNNLTIELNCTPNSNDVVEYKEFEGIPYTLVNSKEEKHLFISGLQKSQQHSNFEEFAEFAFAKLESILDLEEFSFTEIVRQWNYIEDILSIHNSEQNYQVFNDVRSKYYTKHGLSKSFPAATGIGIKEGGVILEIQAQQSTTAQHISDIANPLQTEAFDYTEKVLEGKPCAGMTQKTTPKFSRAKLIGNTNEGAILISGTASIHGEETIGLNDVRKQTEVTISNINQLISSAIRANDGDASLDQNKLDYIRVYIKTPADFDTIKMICDNELPAQKVVFVEADICRGNLLVEIEGAGHIFFNSL